MPVEEVILPILVELTLIVFVQALIGVLDPSEVRDASIDSL